MADLAKRYLEDHVAKRCKPKTQRTARSVVNRHIVPALGKLPIAAVERRHVMALHESLCEIPAMANMVVETLTYMYKLAKGWDMVPEDLVDPCQSIPMNPKRKRERFVTDAEFTRLGQVLDEVSSNGSQVSTGAITTIRLLMLTGCRKTEIMTLRWKHVDLDRAEIRIVNGKTGDRTVHLSPSAVNVLAALPREPDHPWVVPGAKRPHCAEIRHLRAANSAASRTMPRANGTITFIGMANSSMPRPTANTSMPRPRETAYTTESQTMDIAKNRRRGRDRAIGPVSVTAGPRG